MRTADELVVEVSLRLLHLLVLLGFLVLHLILSIDARSVPVDQEFLPLPVAAALRLKLSIGILFQIW